MSRPTARDWLCTLNEPTPVSIGLVALVGAVGLGLLITDLMAGEPFSQQAWFIAFVIAYAVGVNGLLTSDEPD